MKLDLPMPRYAITISLMISLLVTLPCSDLVEESLDQTCFMTSLATLAPKLPQGHSSLWSFLLDDHSGNASHIEEVMHENPKDEYEDLKKSIEEGVTLSSNILPGIDAYQNFWSSLEQPSKHEVSESFEMELAAHLEMIYQFSKDPEAFHLIHEVTQYQQSRIGHPNPNQKQFKLFALATIAKSFGRDHNRAALSPDALSELASSLLAYSAYHDIDHQTVPNLISKAVTNFLHRHIVNKDIGGLNEFIQAEIVKAKEMSSRLNAKEILNFQTPLVACISKDLKLLAFIRDSEIIIKDIDSTSEKTLNAQLSGTILAIDLSPDNSRLAVLYRSAEQVKLRVMTLQSAESVLDIKGDNTLTGPLNYLSNELIVVWQEQTLYSKKGYVIDLNKATESSSFFDFADAFVKFPLDSALSAWSHPFLIRGELIGTYSWKNLYLFEPSANREEDAWKYATSLSFSNLVPTPGNPFTFQIDHGGSRFSWWQYEAKIDRRGDLQEMSLGRKALDLAVSPSGNYLAVLLEEGKGTTALIMKVNYNKKKLSLGKTAHISLPTAFKDFALKKGPVQIDNAGCLYYVTMPNANLLQHHVFEPNWEASSSSPETWRHDQTLFADYLKNLENLSSALNTMSKWGKLAWKWRLWASPWQISISSPVTQFSIPRRIPIEASLDYSVMTSA